MTIEIIAAVSLDVKWWNPQKRLFVLSMTWMNSEAPAPPVLTKPLFFVMVSQLGRFSPNPGDEIRLE